MELIQGEKFRNIANNNNIYYYDTHNVNNFLKNPPKDNFILVTHNSDGKISDNPNIHDADVRLIPNNLIKWYGQNVCFNHEKIESIPIGLENSEWFQYINKRDKMKRILDNKKQMKNLLYVNHNINTNPKEREKAYNVCVGEKWATVENGQNGMNFDNYLHNIYNHSFVICPEGNGTDTHRTWECLYLNTIPIEKRNINNQFYTDLPICFVDDWCEINKTFLENEYKRITNHEWNLEKLDINYWKYKISNTKIN